MVTLPYLTIPRHYRHHNPVFPIHLKTQPLHAFPPLAFATAQWHLPGCYIGHLNRSFACLFTTYLYVLFAPELHQQVRVQQRRNVAAVGDFRAGHRKSLPHRWRHEHVDSSDGISRRHRPPRDRKRVPAKSDSISYQPGWPVWPQWQSLRVMTSFHFDISAD